MGHFTHKSQCAKTFRTVSPLLLCHLFSSSSVMQNTVEWVERSEANPTVPVVASLPPRIRLWFVGREIQARPSAWDWHESSRSRGQNHRWRQEETRCRPPRGQRCRRNEPDRADLRRQVRYESVRLSS